MKPKHEFYTYGVYVMEPQFPLMDILDGVCAKFANNPWSATNPSFSQYSQTWTSVNFIKGSVENKAFFEIAPEMHRVRDYFKCEVRILALYRAEPGLKLHPHIDMTGHLAYGYLRIHIPITTNPDAVMTMGSAKPKAFHLPRGEMWALDTSHTHGVENKGPTERVHLMAEIKVNDWILAQLPPKDLNYFLHLGTFFAYHVPKALVKRRLKRLGLIKQIGYE